MRALARRAILPFLLLSALVLGFGLWSSGLMPQLLRPALGANENVSVIDGDSLQVGGDVIQLYGLDAPELGQLCRHDEVWVHCGLEAAYQLEKLLRIELKPIECIPVPGAPDKDAQGRLLRDCHIGAADLGHVLLSGGYAVVAAESSVEYRQAEASAKAASLGLWRAPFVTPADWLAGQRLPGEEQATGTGKDSNALACPIKALSDGGQHGSYFVPTDKIYESVEIDPARGDRLLCSDESAVAGGWHRP